MVRSTRYIEYLKDPQLNTTAWAFKRSNTQPSRPTGGSYASPVPSSGGWTRQVPSGEEKLWCVTRVFTSDGLAPQDENWSDPRPLSETSDFDMVFSEVQSPNPPSGHPNTNTQWSGISTGLTTWMAVCRKRNGTWTAWQVFRTRGNDGTSLTPKGSFLYYFATQSEADAAVSGGTWQSGKYALMVRNNAPAVALYNGSTVSYTEAQTGDAYIKEDSGEFYIAEADGWRNVGVIRGPAGASAYIHIKFATSLTRNSWTGDNGETPGPYIGIYADNDAADRLDWDLYSWMQWKGADGYGYEYIYKRTSSASAPSVPSTSENTDGYLPSGWSADPVSTTNTYKYCWLCYRKKTDGSWGAWRGSDASHASLWSKYGETGPQGPEGPQGPQGPATPVYMLKPNKDSVDFHSAGNGASYTPGLVTLRCGYVKCVGETTTSYDYPSTGVIEGKYYLLFRLIKANGQPEPTFGGNQANGWDWIDNNSSGYKDGDGNLIIPSTTTYSAVEFVLSSAVPSLANDTTDIIAKVSIPILRIKDGDRGPRVRGPRAWSDCPVGTSFMSGAEGEPSYDVVLYNGHYYDCDKSHTKTADNYPGSAISEQQGYWNLAFEQDLVATKIMLATYALVKNLGVECIDMRDGNNDILCQIKDGNVICKLGLFENITVREAAIESGRVGGFKISGGTLTNRLNNDNDPLPNASIVFIENLSNGNIKRCAGIGSQVSNFITGNTAMGRFENNESKSGAADYNYALLLKASNAPRNFCFHGSGNGVLDGFIEGVRYQPIELTTSGVRSDIYTHLRVTNRFFIKSTVPNNGVILPRYQDVITELGLPSNTTKFCLRLMVQADPMSAVFKLYGRTGDISGASSTDYPLFLNHDAGTFSYVEMNPCDIVELFLVYDAGRTATLGNYDIKYTARVLVRLE